MTKAERVPAMKRQETARLRALIPSVMAAHPDRVWWNQQQIMTRLGCDAFWLNEAIIELREAGRIQAEADPLSHVTHYRLPPE